MIDIDPYIDGILRDWARWAKRRNWASATCASAEKMYRPELGEVWDDEPLPLPIDAREAWKVECTWRVVPMKERMSVKAAYITAPSYRDVEAWDIHKKRHCRKIGIQKRDFEAYVRRGANMIYNRLRSMRMANTISGVEVPADRSQIESADEPPSRAVFALAVA